MKKPKVVSKAGKIKKGPATEEGRRRIGEAHIKTGKWTKKAIEDRLKNRKLTSETRALLESVQKRIDLWTRMASGDKKALYELTEEVFGEDEVFHQNLDHETDDDMDLE